jgi:two-component system heavy metal sensor histidine kinase CusS
LKHSLDNARYGMLAGKVEVLAALVKAPEKEAVLANEVEHEAAESQPFKYYFRILNDQGGLLHETPGMSRLVPSSLFPPPLEVGAEPRGGIQRMVWSGQSLLVLSLKLPASAAAGAETRTLQAALDVSAGAALLANYRTKLLLVLVAGISLTALAGAWIARQGLRPVWEITRTAQHITASQLHERIVGENWPTELAELAASFDAMLDRLEDSFIRLSQFAGDLAHELRTPINNLRGEAEVALSRSRTPAEYQQILASSLEEFDRLSRMIDGLLFLARADNPTNAMQRVLFDARREIDAVCDFHEAQAAEAGVVIEREGAALLAGDPMLFRRAVSNLLSNGLRHTNRGGRIHLRLRPVGDRQVELTVADTGTGIPAEDLPRIFDRFYRVAGAPAHPAPGVGLGLAIVQSIVRLHGGTVAVRSQVGQGTVFTLLFPSHSTPPR